MFETLRFAAAALCIITGLFFEISAVVGVFRFRYALNRMHAAALGDTMGLFLIMLGLAIANGFNMVSIKILGIVVLFWFTSPISSHLIGRLELTTNDELEKELRTWKR